MSFEEIVGHKYAALFRAGGLNLRLDVDGHNHGVTALLNKLPGLFIICSVLKGTKETSPERIQIDRIFRTETDHCSLVVANTKQNWIKISALTRSKSNRITPFPLAGCAGYNVTGAAVPTWTRCLKPGKDITREWGTSVGGPLQAANEAIEVLPYWGA